MKLLMGILSCLLFAGCNQVESSKGPRPKISIPLPKLNTETKAFASCEALTAWQRERKATYEKEYGAYWNWANGSVVAVSMASGPASSASTSTNIQVDGVDEPDSVKTMGANLFVARTGRVEVIGTTDYTLKQTLDFQDSIDLKMFAESGRLMVLASYRDHVIAFIYKSAAAGFFLEKSFRLSGQLVSARLSDHQVLIVNRYEDIWELPSNFEVPCENIQRPLIDDFNRTLTAIHRLDFSNPTEMKSVAHIGRADRMYVNHKNLYFVGDGYSWFGWDERLLNDGIYISQIIVKYDWRVSEAPKYEAAGTIGGDLRNEFAFHENTKAGTFYAATSFWVEGVQANRLWVLKQEGSDLKRVGESEDFGYNEDIRAIRYLNDRAYIVTFEKTDPLFVFDLTVPDSPRLLSRLEVPGFSAYLHPLTSRTLLGVGYDGFDMGGFSWLGGLKLSKFDISNSPIEIEARVFGGRGSHTDVSVDHHALVHDLRGGIVTLPVRVLKSDSSLPPWRASQEVEFSGAFVLDANRTLEPIARITHWDWLPQACRDSQAQGGWWNYSNPTKDVRRVILIKGKWVSVSSFGVKIHDPRCGFRVIKFIQFAESGLECPVSPH